MMEKKTKKKNQKVLEMWDSVGLGQTVFFLHSSSRCVQELSGLLGLKTISVLGYFGYTGMDVIAAFTLQTVQRRSSRNKHIQPVVHLILFRETGITLHSLTEIQFAILLQQSFTDAKQSIEICRCSFSNLKGNCGVFKPGPYFNMFCCADVWLFFFASYRP